MLIFMHVNENILRSDLVACLTADGILEEFSQKFYGRAPPNTCMRGTHPINAAIKTSRLEITDFGLPPFYESPGDHRAMVVGITTRSMLGRFEWKVARPISRKLVTTNAMCLARYLLITDEHEQFDQAKPGRTPGSTSTTLASKDVDKSLPSNP